MCNQWDSVARVTRSPRVFLQQPKGLVAEASATASFPLSSYLHAWIVSAVKVAEAAAAADAAGDHAAAAGLDAQLPGDLPRTRSRENIDRARIGIPATIEDRDRWNASLGARGSSVQACTREALEALVIAGGSWEDAAMPGAPPRAWHAAGAA